MTKNLWGDPSGTLYVAPFADEDEERAWIAAEQAIKARAKSAEKAGGKHA